MEELTLQTKPLAFKNALEHLGFQGPDTVMNFFCFLFMLKW